MKVKHIAVVSLAVLAILGAVRLRADDAKLLRIADDRQLSLDQVLPDLQKVPLVFVGESHNEKAHHDSQLEVIHSLKAAGKSVAIGLEMFQKDSQKELDEWVAGEISEEDFIRSYYRNWNFPWPLYSDLFLYARKYRIPMIGLNVPPEVVRKVAQKGFASLSEEEKAGLPPVTCSVDRNYREFILRALGAHTHGGMNFTHFCEAQLLWDSVMAANLVSYLTEHPDQTVVVVAGSGHAWKQGIPRQVEALANIPYRVILQGFAGKSGVQSNSKQDADYLWLH